MVYNPWSAYVRYKKEYIDDDPEAAERTAELVDQLNAHIKRILETQAQMVKEEKRKRAEASAAISE